MILENINQPSDIKKVDPAAYGCLAEEIRRFLIVHAPGRLVEDEEARFRGQRPRDLQQALPLRKE